MYHCTLQCVRLFPLAGPPNRRLLHHRASSSRIRCQLVDTFTVGVAAARLPRLHQELPRGLCGAVCRPAGRVTAVDSSAWQLVHGGWRRRWRAVQHDVGTAAQHRRQRAASGGSKRQQAWWQQRVHNWMQTRWQWASTLQPASCPRHHHLTHHQQQQQQQQHELRRTWSWWRSNPPPPYESQYQPLSESPQQRGQQCECECECVGCGCSLDASTVEPIVDTCTRREADRDGRPDLSDMLDLMSCIHQWNTQQQTAGFQATFFCLRCATVRPSSSYDTCTA